MIARIYSDTRDASYARDRYKQLRAMGLCTQCKQPAVPGCCMCSSCQEKRRTYALSSYRTAKGILPDTPKWKRVAMKELDDLGAKLAASTPKGPDNFIR